MKNKIIISALFILFTFAACKEKEKNKIEYVLFQKGKASWYGPGFHGKTTANGEKYNMNDLTAAHRTLDFGTIVRVTNLDNMKSIEVRINDRGPVSKSRIIDLSKKAAEKLEMIEKGVQLVTIEIKKNKK